MPKNPILVKKYEQGYNDGFLNGAEYGKQKAIEFFSDRFKGIDKIDGIGNKTLEKLKNHLGNQYFKG